MSQVTAIIADTSSVGYTMSADHTPASHDSLYVSQNRRRNPQNAVARIRTVMNPHTIQEVPGGMISADFTIPAEEAQRWRPMLRYGAYCWLFDGQTPFFFGRLKQPIWTPQGDAQIIVDGPWAILGTSRTREVWELRDLALWNRSSSTNEKRDAEDRILNDGSLLLSFENGSAVNNGQFVSVEYVLPFSSGGGTTLDAPVITGFEVHVSDATFNGNANLVFRVQSITDNTGAGGTTLYSTTAVGSSNRHTAEDVFSENTPAGAWSGGAAHGLRMGIFATANITAGGSAFVKVDRMRITTRQRLMPSNTGTQDTAAIARDLLQPQQSNAAAFRLPEFLLPEPFWPNSTTNIGNSDASVPYTIDAVTGTGTAPNSGVGVTGFNIVEMTSPAEILLQLASIDGYHVGFYLPYNQRGGYDAGNVNDAGVSLWVSARPQLYYQAWPDPKTNPDYTISVREGAQLDPQDSPQDLLNVGWMDYQTIRGRQLSSDFVDGDPIYSAAAPSGTTFNSLNYLTNQGFRSAENWTLDSSVDAPTALSLLEGMTQVRRNPLASSLVTITNDGTTRFPILKAGSQLAHLSQIRPGSVRVVDVPAAGGLKQGYATRVEWWGVTLNDPERVEITLSDPGQMMLERRMAWAAIRANRQRVTGG